MSKFWTNTLNNLDPYVPGEQPQDQKYIKLNTNENPYPPSPKVLEALQSNVSNDLRLYPDPNAKRLKQAIANYHNLEEQNIFVGNGSDEVLALAFYSFFEKKNPLLFPDLSYSFYPVYCAFYNLPHRTQVVNENFEIELETYLKKESSGVIFPNPNAPTGQYLSQEKIREFLNRYKKQVVIVDEAYIDFGGESAVVLLKEFDNLLIVQTFSKSRSLAGMRVGFALGHKDLIEGLDRTKNSFNSYPLDKLAQVAAIAALNDKSYFKEQADKIIKTRQWTVNQLEELGFKVIPSKANFVLVSPPDENAQKLYLSLKKNGILVRYFKGKRIDKYCRITIGTQQEMETLVKTLKSMI